VTRLFKVNVQIRVVFFSDTAILAIETRETLSLEVISMFERFGGRAYWDSVLMGRMV